MKLNISFLDKDEITDFILSLKDFKSYISEEKDSNYVELIYQTRDGFEFSCFIDKIKQRSTITKDVKFYVDTKESTYEEHEVFKDEAGKYILKTMTYNIPVSYSVDNWRIMISSGVIYKSEISITIKKLDDIIKIFEKCERIMNTGN